MIVKAKYQRLGYLNELHAISVLLYLKENKEAYATDLRVISGHYDGIKRLLERLRDMGLVEIEIEDYPRVKIKYRLTSKGRKVAEKLEEIEELMGE